MQIAILLQKYVCVYQVTCVWAIERFRFIVYFDFPMKNGGKIQKRLLDIQIYHGVAVI